MTGSHLRKKTLLPWSSNLNTPISDTLLGVITGNIGPEAVANIDSTLYTLQQAPWWNLKHYFTNDDQNILKPTQKIFMCRTASCICKRVRWGNMLPTSPPPIPRTPTFRLQ
ncbi:MAG: hypothetical protein U5Q03_02615 [Bacteroidota bacterium]|nr:hypothetical protein [Bacteroidota bacterium]